MDRHHPAKCIAPTHICDHHIVRGCYGNESDDGREEGGGGSVPCQWLELLKGAELQEFIVTQMLCGDTSYQKYLVVPVTTPTDAKLQEILESRSPRRGTA